MQTLYILGIVVHFFDHDTKKPAKLLIACVHAPPPHTAAAIGTLFQSIWIGDYELSYEKIYFGVTDNGTNLVKLFRSVII